MTTRPLGAQISHMLKARGVEVIFGIPGVHNQELYRGIEEAGLRHVLPRHEQGAGFMADGYARATGRPGVCYVITGPGLTNILTPMGQAYSDSVPMLVISSCLDEAAARRGQLHQMRDQEAAARTVADWSETARTAGAAYTLIERALVEFQVRRPRPRHIQVPISVLWAEADPPAPPPASLQPPGSGRTAAAPVAADTVRDVAQALLAARRPLVIFGGGARHAGGPGGPARALVGAARAASFVTYAGRGILAPDDPLHFGAYLARPGSAEVLASTDLVLLIGTDLAEVDIWRGHPGHTARAVVVNTDPEVLAAAAPGDLRIDADASRFLEALAAALDGPPGSRWAAAEVAAARTRWRAEVDAERPGIVAVCDALRAALPPDTMVFSDMTRFAYTAKEVWDMPAPGLWHHPFGFGTLGYALPAAIGGKVGRPGAPVVAIAGDYGLQYTVQELATAVELRLPLPILLWDNGKLGEIEASMERAQIAPNAVTLRNPDFLALARAYGAFAVEPRSLADLCDAATRALSASAPTLIRMTPGLAGS